MDCLTHETAGTARAKTSPRKHAGQKRAERQQHQKDQTGGWRGQQLLNTGQQHNVHRNEDSNSVYSLGPNQPDTRLFVFGLSPFGETTHDTGYQGE